MLPLQGAQVRSLVEDPTHLTVWPKYINNIIKTHLLSIQYVSGTVTSC